MQVEATRLITAWLGHSVHGVNALIPAIPRERFGGVDDPEPSEVSIYNDVDFDTAMDESVLGINPPSLPALVVIFDVNPKGLNFGQTQSNHHEYDMVGAVFYYAKDGLNRMAARREGGYVLRAVGRSLKRWNQPRFSELRSGPSYRRLNDIKLLRITNLTFVRPAGAVPESQMMGVVFLDMTVQDQAPE
jgi:hypothetical protein